MNAIDPRTHGRPLRRIAASATARRRLGLRALRIACAAALLGAAAAQAADDYPSRTVRIVFPFPTGSVADLGRLVAEKLGERFKQTFVLETRPGASGNLGAEQVAKAAPDGYTLMMTPPPPLAVNQALFGKLPYDPAAFVPVSLLATMPNVLVAARGFGPSTVAEVLAQARANPDRLTYASTGNGGTPHLTSETFKSVTGVRLVHVPYQGIGPALPDVATGRVDLMFANVAGVMPLLADGRLKAIAVTSAERLPQLPQVPTVAETVPGFTSDAWLALAAPAGTPKPVVDRLSAAVREVMRQPDVVARFRQAGAVPVGGTAEEAASFVRRESERFAEVIRAANIKAE